MPNISNLFGFPAVAQPAAGLEVTTPRKGSVLEQIQQTNADAIKAAAPSALATSAIAQLQTGDPVDEMPSKFTMVENMPSQGPCGDAVAMTHEEAEATLAPKHVTFKDRIASFITPVTSFLNHASSLLARQSTGSAQVAPINTAPEARPSIEQLLSQQYTAVLKIKGFVMGRFGYEFFKLFSFLANKDTKALIGRISTLEKGAAAVKEAANKVAKALAEKEVNTGAIKLKQENKFLATDRTTGQQVSLLDAIKPLLERSTDANKELSKSLHELMATTKNFIDSHEPSEGFLLCNHTAYTQMLSKLVKENSAGIKLSDTRIAVLSDINFFAGSTIRNETVDFATTVKKAMETANEENTVKIAFPNIHDELILPLQTMIGKDDAEKAFIFERIVKKLGCKSLDLIKALETFIKTDAATISVPKLEDESTQITAIINGYAKKISELQDKQIELRGKKAECRKAFVDAMLAHIKRAREERLGQELAPSNEAIYLAYVNMNEEERATADLKALELLAYEVNFQPVNILELTQADKEAQATWRLVLTTNKAHLAAQKAHAEAVKAYKEELVKVFGEMPTAAEIFEKDAEGKVIGFKTEQTPGVFAKIVRDLAKTEGTLAQDLAKLDEIPVRAATLKETFAEKQKAATMLLALIKGENVPSVDSFSPVVKNEQVFESLEAFEESQVASQEAPVAQEVPVTTTRSLAEELASVKQDMTNLNQRLMNRLGQ